MLAIGDVVSLDEQAQFRNDVQLSAVEDPVKNLALLRSYLFTSTAPNSESAGLRYYSSIDVLEQVVQAFLDARLENRMAAIANYGHGKSHLALALANYFGKPYDSPEVQLLLSKLPNTNNGPRNVKRYREFKENSGEFLVVRLRGDEPRNLREQVLTGIEKAVDEHAQTAGKRPNFWYTSARTFLQKLPESDCARADSYLEQFSIDMPMLVRQVEERKDVYELCIDLFVHLYGVRPHFGGEVALSSVVEWAIHTCCGPEGPMKGVLFLFDEFSAYIERHANRQAGSELQDLLNGIEKQQGKAVLLAFAQHDPMSLANSLALQGNAKESLAKALNRVPRRFVLYSLMESVIDAYLATNDSSWQQIVEDTKLRGGIYQATDVAYQSFQARYDRELRWPFEKFQETVTKGCFPLHPVTTVLLCNLRYAAVSDLTVPRTVLGFVLEQLERCKSEPVVTDGRINWVLPIHLVDYFEPRLKGELYKAYRNALQRLDLDAPAEHIALLKAMLLYELAGLKINGEDQVHFLAQCAGVQEKQALDTLRALTEKRCLRYDRMRKVNLFVASEESPELLEELIGQRLSGMEFSEDDAEDMEANIARLPDVALGQIAIGVKSGDSSDWAAREFLLAGRFATEERLRELVQPFEPLVREVNAGDRGCVVWLWAENDSELSWLRSNMAALIDKTFDGDYPIPIVCLLPEQPIPELLAAYQRLTALLNILPDEQQRVGQKTYDDEVTSAKLALLRAFHMLRGEEKTYQTVPRPTSAFCVPKVYRRILDSIQKPSVQKVLTESYAAAYPNAPAFITHLKLNNTNLKTATKLIAGALLGNSPETLRTTSQTDRMTGDLCSQLLQKKWGILARDFRIQEPESLAVLRAWNAIDAAFPPGCKETPVEETIIALLNPPHGYDWNTATLLFCAWFGYHNHDLQVIIQGKQANRSALAESLKKGPREFINEICIQRPVALARRDVGQITNEILALVQQLRLNTYSQEQAQKHMAALAEYAKDERNRPEIRQQAESGATLLADSLTLAYQYDQEANDIRQSLTKGDIGAVVALLGRVGKLPATDRVLPQQPGPAELRTMVQERLDGMVNADCARFLDLKQLTQVDHYIAQLKQRSQIFSRAGLPTFAQRFDQAIENVNAKARQLEGLKREEEIRVEIRAMDSASRLMKLREFQSRLEQMAGFSDETMRLRDQKLKAVTQQIELLEQQAARWCGEVDKITDLPALQKQYGELLRVADRFSGSEWVDSFAETEQRLKALQDFLYDLAALQTNIKAGFRYPSDGEVMLKRLSDLRERYTSQLSYDQMQLIDDTVAEVHRQTRVKTDNAIKWLREREQEYSTGGNLVSLKKGLLEPPAFLPQEAHRQLQSLIVQVQQRIDDDAVSAIEAKFLEIADFELRRKCVQRLEQLLQPVA